MSVGKHCSSLMRELPFEKVAHLADHRSTYVLGHAGKKQSTPIYRICAGVGYVKVKLII